jgi:hypothetical protein
MATSTIACNCASIGALSKLLLETAGDGSVPRTFAETSKRLEFVYETLGTQRNLISNQAITGALGNRIYGVRKGSYLTQGMVAYQCSPATLHILLPLILGGAVGAEGSGLGEDVDSDGDDRNYPLANVIPSFDHLVYREAGIFQYTNLRVAQTIIRGKTANGSQDGNEFVELILVLVGEQELITETGDSSPWPATEPDLSTGASSIPYQFSETNPYLNDTLYDYDGFKLTIDNMLMVKFFQHLYPTCIRSTGRRVTLELDMPFNCGTLEEALALYNADGTAEIRMATPSDSVAYHTSFELPFARNAFKTPTTQGRDDIPLKLLIQGFDDEGNDNLQVTNDSADA